MTLLTARVSCAGYGASDARRHARAPGRTPAMGAPRALPAGVGAESRSRRAAGSGSARRFAAPYLSHSRSSTSAQPVALRRQAPVGEFRPADSVLPEQRRAPVGEGPRGDGEGAYAVERGAAPRPRPPRRFPRRERSTWILGPGSSARSHVHVASPGEAVPPIPTSTSCRPRSSSGGSAAHGTR
jgi:hypothetical protein